MKTIEASWQEKDGHPALAVRFPRMFPFQIEEIEQIASDLGFGVDRAGQRRALGDDTGVWSVPGPGAAITNLYAVEALRTALGKLGYLIELPVVANDEGGDPDWLKYGEAEMSLPAFECMKDRQAEVDRRKAIIAIESTIKSLSGSDLNEEQQKTLAVGEQLYRDGQVREAYQLLRDLGRVAEVASKVIVATWLTEPVGALRLSYPLSLSEAERLLVERLGTIFGFAVEGDVWIAPEGGESIVAWRNELSAAGIETQFEDSAELIRATHKTLELKSLDPEKVAPFLVDLSEFSEAEKSAIKKAAWECRFQFEGDILTPPDMNESYLMFRNKMREARFLLKIVHEDNS